MGTMYGTHKKYAQKTDVTAFGALISVTFPFPQDTDPPMFQLIRSWAQSLALLDLRHEARLCMGKQRLSLALTTKNLAGFAIRLH